MAHGHPACSKVEMCPHHVLGRLSDAVAACIQEVGLYVNIGKQQRHFPPTPSLSAAAQKPPDASLALPSPEGIVRSFLTLASSISPFFCALTLASSPPWVEGVL